MGEWQDMRTAPQDGTKILGFIHSYGYPEDTEIEIIWYYPSKFFWSCQGYGDPNIDWGIPTHWMPLPAPPSTPTDHASHGGEGR